MIRLYLAVSGETENRYHETRRVKFAMLFDGEQWIPKSDFKRPDRQDLGRFSKSVTFAGRMFLYTNEKLTLPKVFEVVICGA